MIVVNKNSIVTFISICIAIVAVGISIYLYRLHKETSKTVSTKAIETIAEAKVIAKEVDKKGIEHTIVEQTNNNLPKELFLNPKTDEDKKTIDSLINNSKVKDNQITSLLQVNYTSQAKNLQAVRVIDSLKRTSLVYTDKDIVLSYTPDTDSTKIGLFSYKFNQQLNVVQYTKGGFLGLNPKSYLDISPGNINTTINNVKKLNIEVKPKTFGISLDGKANYNFLNKDFNAGPSVRLRVGKTTINGDYMYNTTDTKFHPWLGVSRELISF